MLPQLSRPDPTISGTNGGIIIGQDFIPLTHHDIPLQSEHYAVPRTVKDSSEWILSRYSPVWLGYRGACQRVARECRGDELRFADDSGATRWGVQTGYLSQRNITGIASWQLKQVGGRVALSRRTERNTYKGLLISEYTDPPCETGNLCLLTRVWFGFKASSDRIFQTAFNPAGLRDLAHLSSRQQETGLQRTDYCLSLESSGIARTTSP